MQGSLLIIQTLNDTKDMFVTWGQKIWQKLAKQNLQNFYQLIFGLVRCNRDNFVNIDWGNVALDSE